MDYIKKVIFAVAGSGKTSSLIQRLNEHQRFLLITYTENNANNLKEKVVCKFGYIPDNIAIYTYFSFVFTFCIRPFLIDNCDTIDRLIFDEYCAPRYASGLSRYISQGNSLYHTRAFDFLEKYIGTKKIIFRIEKFFDFVFVDEVQDFAGYDFDFITLLGKTNVNTILVGDFFQHTFDTSRDGNKNANLHDNFDSYKMHFSRLFEIDETSMAVSYRCSNEICKFIRDNIKIQIYSCRQDETSSKPALIHDEKSIRRIMEDSSIKKLFYSNSKKYSCNASNWGDCKGLTFGDVCVVLNEKTYNLFRSGKLESLPPTSRNKFYVACTRTSGELCFIREKDVAEYRMA